MSELPATYDSLAVAYDALCTELAAANEARDQAKADLMSREQDAWRAGYDFAKLHFYDIPLRNRDEMFSHLAGALKDRAVLRAEVERLREALRKEAHIIFDGPPGPTGPHFVEVEDGSGRSIRCGEWRRDRACYWSLVISGNDIAAIDAARKGS